MYLNWCMDRIKSPISQMTGPCITTQHVHYCSLYIIFQLGDVIIIIIFIGVECAWILFIYVFISFGDSLSLSLLVTWHTHRPVWPAWELSIECDVHESWWHPWYLCRCTSWYHPASLLIDGLPSVEIYSDKSLLELTT